MLHLTYSLPGGLAAVVSATQHHNMRSPCLVETLEYVWLSAEQVRWSSAPKTVQPNHCCMDGNRHAIRPVLAECRHDPEVSYSNWRLAADAVSLRVS
jgi:hypothetical protein